MGHLAEPVHNGEDNIFFTGALQPCHKIHRNVGPWTTRDRQRLKESRWGLSSVLELVPGDGGSDVVPNVVSQGRPPESLLEESAHGLLDNTQVGRNVPTRAPPASNLLECRANCPRMNWAVVVGREQWEREVIFDRNVMQTPVVYTYAITAFCFLCINVSQLHCSGLAHQLSPQTWTE